MNPITRLSLAAALLAALHTAHAAGQTCLEGAPFANRFTISADGGEVTDTATGLVWKRCAEGYMWAGTTCTGTATLYKHQVALGYAKAVHGGKWRLPNIRELSSLVEPGCAEPAIDATAFPETDGGFWSSSPVLGSPGNVWYVNFSGGKVGLESRDNGQRVRLVRTSP